MHEKNLIILKLKPKLNYKIAQFENTFGIKYGEIISLAMLPSLIKLILIPSGSASSDLKNHFIIIMFLLELMHSPPSPITTLPMSIAVIEFLKEPQATINCPIEIRIVKTRYIALAPNLSISNPPIKGKMIFGIEYTEYKKEK